MLYTLKFNILTNVSDPEWHIWTISRRKCVSDHIYRYPKLYFNNQYILEGKKCKSSCRTCGGKKQLLLLISSLSSGGITWQVYFTFIVISPTYENRPSSIFTWSNRKKSFVFKYTLLQTFISIYWFLMFLKINIIYIYISSIKNQIYI